MRANTMTATADSSTAITTSPSSEASESTNTDRKARVEQLICRILCVKPKVKGDTRDVHRVFSISMVISGLRCLFSYVLAPFVAPAVGAFSTPIFGIVLSCIAITFDIRGLRRFWSSSHPQRWSMTVVYCGVIIFVLVLLGSDISRLAH